MKAFALGYELTGEPELLDAARYWAWTGVPFVYLVNPTGAKEPGAVGPFATIPVLGATNWVAPELDRSARAVVRPGLRGRADSACPT